MGWCTTSDLEQFTAMAGGYLRSQAAENTLLLSAVQAAQLRAAGGQRAEVPAAGLLFGWWEPPGGGVPRGAFLHDPQVPLLVAGRIPELAATLAATLAKLGRQVRGVDAPTDAADAFAAAWSQRAGTTARVHRRRSVYRLGGEGAADGHRRGQGPGLPGNGTAASGTGGWPSPGIPGPPGRLRVATSDDHPLLASWLAAFTAETAERIGSPAEVAADLIGYGGAVFWEVPPRPGRLRDAAHYLPIPHRREGIPSAEPGYQPVALAALTQPVVGIVRISMVYTPQERRRSGHALAASLAVSRALLAGGIPGGAPGGLPGLLRGAAPGSRVDEVVMITEGNRLDRGRGRFGYQLVGERTVLRFGAGTSPLPRLRETRPMPRLSTGALPRLPR